MGLALTEFLSVKSFLEKQRIKSSAHLKNMRDPYTYKHANGKESKPLVAEEGDETKKIKLSQPSLMMCLFRTFYGKFLVGSLVKLLRDILIFASPILLG
jgi:hypothetical protein